MMRGSGIRLMWESGARNPEAVEWWSGGVVEWWSGGVVEWWSGGVVEGFVSLASWLLVGTNLPWETRLQSRDHRIRVRLPRRLRTVVRSEPEMLDG
jgi:hypothetical protein